MNPNNELLANSLIALVRDRVIDSVQNDPDADQWDEGEGGAGWLDNELGFVDELISAYGGSKPPSREGEELNTVADFKNWLAARSTPYLLVQCRLNELGGTDSPQLWNIVEHIRATKQITDTQREFLSNYFVNYNEDDIVIS